MAKTREELQHLLDELNRSMPAMLKTCPEEIDFWPALARAVDVIQDSASARDYEWVADKIDLILSKHGKAISADLPPSSDLPRS
jgi:hypothetical protein